MGSLFGFIWYVVTKTEVKIKLTNSSSQPPTPHKKTTKQTTNQWKQTNKIPREDQEVVICKWQQSVSNMRKVVMALCPIKNNAIRNPKMYNVLFLDYFLTTFCHSWSVKSLNIMAFMFFVFFKCNTCNVMYLCVSIICGMLLCVSLSDGKLESHVSHQLCIVLFAPSQCRQATDVVLSLQGQKLVPREKNRCCYCKGKMTHDTWNFG